MYLSIRKHKIKNATDIKNNQLPFQIDTNQKLLIEITSYKNGDMSSDYDYDVLLKRILTSGHVHYPLFFYLESYSAELVETALASQKRKFSVLSQRPSTTLFKITCTSFEECESLFPLLYEAGIDSLFNMITMSDQAVTIQENEIRFDGKTSSLALCFSDDLQGLFLVGAQKWCDIEFVKNEFFTNSLILDEIELDS